MLALLLGLASAVEMGPVAKVIQLLDELSAKVQANSQSELAEFTEYSRWCDGTRRDKEHAIGDSKRSIEDLTATVESSKAEIDQLRTKVEELSGSISSNEEDLAKAKQLRSTEQKQFETTDAELTETISTLVRAQDVLSKHQKQSNLVEVKANLEKVTASLTQIVEASWVNTNQKQEIEAFLQKDDDADEFSLAQQPQASQSAYDSHSSGILETLADLQGKAEQAQQEARKEEMSKQHSYDMLAQSIDGELKAQQKQLEDAKKNMAVNSEAQSEAEGDLDATQRTLAQDSKDLEELKAGCQEKAQEFEANTKGRAEELEALHNAKNILQGGVPEEHADLLQTPTFVQVRAHMQESAQMQEAKDAAVLYLEKLGRQLNSVALTQDAVTMRADPFGKVKALIEDMVEKLLLEASNEADKKAWCDNEIGKTGTARDEKQRKLDNADTHIEKAEATSAKLAEAVNELNRELAAMDASMSEATKLRQEEHAQFEKETKDYADGQEATASAISVLRKYYEGGSFLQGGGSGPGVAENGGTASAIIGMLEVAEADFSRMEADARAAESAAQKTFDDLEREHQVTRAAKTAEMKAKSGEQKRLDNEAGDYKMDRQGVQKELDAVLTYNEKLKPECEVKAPTYEARAQRRKQELEGLQNALEILEGKALAFVQTQQKVARFLAP